MRKTLKIAKLELSVLFYSPVAWLVLAIFMIQGAISFLGTLQVTHTSLSLGYQTMPITKSLFGGTNGLFTGMQGTLYLYLPILTMGLMSREISSGSIKLLLSSPVKLRQIILGKYLAIITYGLALIAILSIFSLIGAVFIKDADLGLIFSGLVGLYLLICTYSAIGLFMSCLTSYQVVAAISTLAIFTVLRYVGTLGQDIDFIRDLTYFLSISGRTEKMISGLITTKDIFYYLIIVASFLSLCVLRMKAERELKPWTIKAGRYALLIFTALLLGYLTSRPVFTGYWDNTAGKSLTITPNSQTIAKQIKGQLKVTTYANMLDRNIWAVLPQYRNTDLGRLEQFKRFIPGMDVDYVYYYQKPVDTNFRDYRFNPNLNGVQDIEKIADKMATSMGVDRQLFIPPGQINKMVNLEPEGYLLARKLEYKGKSTFLRFYTGDNDPYASEAEVSAALKRLLMAAPKIVFVTGNKERSIDNNADRDYRQISSVKPRRKALVNQGFDVDTINLNTQVIPSDANIVVLADPVTPLSPIAQLKLISYIDNGGNMLITGEPGRQDILNPILQHVGEQLKAGLLVKPDKNTTPGFINAQIPANAASIDSNLARMQKGGGTISIQGAAAVETVTSGSFKVEPLLLSNSGGWNKILSGDNVGKNVGQTAKEPPVSKQATESATAVAMPQGAVAATAAMPVNNVVSPVKPMMTTKLGSVDLSTADLSFNASLGDQKGIFPVAVSLTRSINGKQQKIVISGDADFVSNGELSRGRSRFNEYFLQGVCRWLSNGAFPVDIINTPAKDIDLKISSGQMTVLVWLCKGLIPGMIALTGVIVLFRRRRK
ncbi:Gldg family protein [Mucilaginibacter sp. SG564]|uniref:Gldg family protein n=1 Tax=Mucilaginibacter sp. SG564 TaxID=2587022 RepID=UPI001553289F|nr:Gldg family protein [Mucilaginibacter sp. SG564]NOW95064.1 ABC-2 type transport system permease protein [Mucilaginibacter sp. SG564]